MEEMPLGRSDRGLGGFEGRGMLLERSDKF